MRLYRALLYLYPASFRAEYGGELAGIFARRRRAATSATAKAALWAEALGDVLGNAARAHWDVLGRDLRYSLRTLGRAPGFTVTAVLLTALGIGATTAAFSVADHVLLRPLPFPQGERLVKLWQDDSFQGYSRNELSPANYRDWLGMSTSFSGVAAYTNRSANLVGAGDPERLDAALVTPGLFRVLGVEAALGRTLGAADLGQSAGGETAGEPAAGSAGRAAVLSDGLWRAFFGADPAVLGRTVVLDGAPHVVVGVMPADFHFPDRDVEIWTPLHFAPEDFEDRTNTYLRVVARLKPGVSLEQAQAEMTLVAARLAREHPEANSRVGAAVVRLRDEVSQQPRLLLMALVGASACMLLIACTNLANLLLARALSRRHELAVRTTLGAGRERLVRQMLTESLLLAGSGGALGVALAAAAVPLIAALVPNALPIAEVPGVDLRMLACAALLTGVTGVGFGVVPALSACRKAGEGALAEGSRAGASRGTERLRSILVVAEVAAAVVLVASSGLLLRALWQVRQVDPGFRAEGVVALRTSLPMPRYEPTARREQFYQRVLADIEALPGVASAAYISYLPMTMRGGIWPVTLDGRPEDPAETRMASLRFVTPGFFRTVGTPLLAGRDVGEADTAKSPFVAVISESFARQYWPGKEPLGRRFKVAFAERTVVGVVGDIRVRGLESESEPQVYLPSPQVPDGSLVSYTPRDLVIRAETPLPSLVPAVRAIVRRADPQQPVSDVQTLADVVDAETAPRRVQGSVLGAFAGIAFLLAAVGIHGLLAYGVASRTREIGVRVALGARAPDILGMVLRRALLLAAAGVVLGTGLAYAAGRTLQALLAGVSPADRTTFAATVALVFLMTIAGCLQPAARALRVDPLSAIRE